MHKLGGNKKINNWKHPKKKLKKLKTAEVPDKLSCEEAETANWGKRAFQKTPATIVSFGCYDFFLPFL